MIVLEILPNPNCSAMEMRLFHDLELPQTVSRVQLERHPGHPAWYEVTGWTAAGMPCPATVQKVDDSGEGVALLLCGGDAGVRLRPADRPEPWRLDSSQQWGEPFLLLAELSDVHIARPSGADETTGSITHG
jgi:hypothetical protein